VVGTVAHRHGHATRESGFHLLLETLHSAEEIFAIARVAGCRAHLAQHGPLRVIEFWIDGCLLLEVATPEISATYRKLAKIAKVRCPGQPNSETRGAWRHGRRTVRS
jgi:hypothetical protein